MRASTTRSKARYMGKLQPKKVTEIRPERTAAKLHQAALVLGGADERREQRVRRERPGFQLRMVLYADEPGMVGDLDDLGQDAVGRHAGEAQAHLLQPVLVVDVDLVAVAVAFAD